MSIDFSQSIDRDLRSFRRKQRIVANLLGPGTRHVAGKDDSGGALHRAAVGSGTLHARLYALTDMVVAATLWSKVPDDTAIVVFARTRGRLYAVFFVMTDPAKSEGLEYSALGVVALRQLPEALNRRPETVSRASAGGLPSTVAPAPHLSEYANIPVGSGDYSQLPNGPGDRSHYGVAIVAP